MPNWTKESAVVAGRTVVVVDGSTTQTINVCGDEGYEWKVRLDRSSVSLGEVNEFADIADLLKWLVTERGGDLEIGELPLAPVQPNPQLIPYSVESDAWVQRARAIVEDTIDRFVNEFTAYPYLHRVEHSIHVRLMHMLVENELQFGPTQLRDGAFTQPVQKEWPETVARTSGSGRKGNFDIVVLSPSQIARNTRELVVTPIDSLKPRHRQSQTAPRRVWSRSGN